MLALAASAFAPASSLTVFEPLIGSCWRAQIAPGTTDTHCFEPMYERAHVRDRHEVHAGGKTVYAGETVYSLEGRAVSFTYVNSLGGVGRGSVAKGGNRLRFDGTMRASPDAQAQPIATEWTLVDRNAYETRDSSSAKVTRFNRVK